MNQEKDIELIDAYLRNELRSSEEEGLKERLKKDSSFKKLLEEQASLQKAIQLNKRKEWLTKMDGFEKNLPDEPNRPNKISQKWMVLGMAAFVLLMLLTVNYWCAKEKLPKEMIASTEYRKLESYITPYSYYGNKRSSQNSPHQTAYDAYNRNDFITAIQLFEQQINVLADTLAYLYLGNAYLMEGKGAEAITNFDQYLALDTTFMDQALYKKALALAINKEEEEAQKILLQMTERKNSYASKAKEVLQKFPLNNTTQN